MDNPTLIFVSTTQTVGLCLLRSFLWKDVLLLRTTKASRFKWVKSYLSSCSHKTGCQFCILLKPPGKESWLQWKTGRVLKLLLLYSYRVIGEFPQACLSEWLRSCVCVCACWLSRLVLCCVVPAGLWESGGCAAGAVEEGSRRGRSSASREAARAA